MWKDPVVEEVRAAREEYAKQFNYDIEAICQDLRQREATSGHQVVSLPAKRLFTEDDKRDSDGKAA